MGAGAANRGRSRLDAGVGARARGLGYGLRTSNRTSWRDRVSSDTGTG
jgi:hypothetical protein